jgi:hypothetical protein
MLVGNVPNCLAGNVPKYLCGNGVAQLPSHTHFTTKLCCSCCDTICYGFIGYIGFHGDIVLSVSADGRVLASGTDNLATGIIGDTVLYRLFNCMRSRAGYAHSQGRGE